ncbi:MAG TPA: AAA family ATPase, partial [Caulobacteraceae bacterium]|nr:AAA family ATPase [Caulobacteraceae bacterium]
MTDDETLNLKRIAEALERLAPRPAPQPEFAGARLFTYAARKDAFIPAADYGLALDLLVGVERQKARIVE